MTNGDRAAIRLIELWCNHTTCNLPPFQTHQDVPRPCEGTGWPGGVDEVSLTGECCPLCPSWVLIPGMQGRDADHPALSMWSHQGLQGRWISLFCLPSLPAVPKRMSLVALKAQAVVAFVLALTKSWAVQSSTGTSFWQPSEFYTPQTLLVNVAWALACSLLPVLTPEPRRCWHTCPGMDPGSWEHPVGMGIGKGTGFFWPAFARENLHRAGEGKVAFAGVIKC